MGKLITCLKPKKNADIKRDAEIAKRQAFALSMVPLIKKHYLNGDSLGIACSKCGLSWISWRTWLCANSPIIQAMADIQTENARIKKLGFESSLIYRRQLEASKNQR